jgi:hypothetical protein
MDVSISIQRSLAGADSWSTIATITDTDTNSSITTSTYTVHSGTQGYSISIYHTIAQDPASGNYDYRAITNDRGLAYNVSIPLQLTVVEPATIGAGNADTLDNQDGTYYLNYNNFTNTPTLITQTDIDNSISALVDSAPATLDTLNELAAALGDNANFAQTTATALGTKMPKAGGTFTGDVTFNGDTSGIEYSDLSNAPKVDFSHLGLVADADMSLDITNKVVSKIGGGSGWSGEVRSSLGFTGGCRLAFKGNINNQYTMVGINTDPTTSPHFNTIDYCFYLDNTNLRIYEGGTSISLHGTFNAETILEIIYNNDKVIYYKDGVAVRTVDVASGLKFHFDSSAYSQLNNLFTILDFAPYASNSANWDAAYGWGDHSTQGYITSISTPREIAYGNSTISGSNSFRLAGTGIQTRFSLVGYNEQDTEWEWRFTQADDVNPVPVNVMTLTPTSSTSANLSVTGSILASDYSLNGTTVINDGRELRSINGLELTNNYSEKVMSTPYFTNNTANLACDVTLGNDYINGVMEFEITGSYSNQNTTGTIRRKWYLGLNANNSIWQAPTVIDETIEGAIADQIYVSNPFWDSGDSTYKIRIYHKVSSGNAYHCKISLIGNNVGGKLLNNISMGSLVTASTESSHISGFNARSSYRLNGTTVIDSSRNATFNSITGSGGLTLTGGISASGYNNTNWNTAYGWGNHASAGYLTSLPSHNHDDRYYTESEVNTFIDHSYVSSQSASNLAVGWYTIATNEGNRASARFGIWDTNSSDHQSVTFYAAHHYGTDSSNTLTVLDNSYYSGNPFRYIRIKDASTYNGAALQIYIDDASNSVNCAILGDNFQSSGWVLCDWIPDATTPPNVSNYGAFGERSKVDLNTIAQGGFATTGEIYAGGDTTQYQVFHNNYHPNADKWTTARTLSLTGDVTGSVSWDGSANASITTAVANDSHSHSNYIASNANDSYSGNITATADDWYLWSLGARGASGGEYGIGNRNDNSFRQLTFHVPNRAAYANSGVIPSFGWYSNGAVELMKLTSDDGDLSVKGGYQVNGTTVIDSSRNIKNVNAIHQQEVHYPNVTYSSSGNTTGRIKIALPDTSSDYDMMTIELTVYEYNSESGTKIYLSGHNWTSGWYNTRATVIGGYSSPIYLARSTTDSKHYIVLGDTDTSWNYVTVHVDKVTTAGFYSVQDWTLGWTVTKVTTENTTYSQISSNMNQIASNTLQTRGHLYSNGLNIGGQTFADSSRNLTNVGTISSGSITGSSLTVSGSGQYVAGSIYSDANWGMLFRAKQASPANAQYRWATSTDSELMRIDNNGILKTSGDIQINSGWGGTYPEQLTIEGSYPSLCLRSTSHDFKYLLHTGGTSLQFYTGSGYNNNSWTRKLELDSSGNLDLVEGSYQINNTTVIDSSRNLTNIGTASLSGAITAQGYIDGTTYVIDSSGSLGVKNSSNTTGKGLSLYGGAVSGMPAYGIAFAGTGTFGTHGGVSGDWATYFTMNDDGSRGWIFKRGTTNVASISGSGHTKFEGYVEANNGLQVFRNLGNQVGGWPTAEHTMSLENNDAGWLSINFHRGGYTSDSLYCTGSSFNFTDNLNLTSGGYQIGTTTVIDSSRNLTNIANISESGGGSKILKTASNGYLQLSNWINIGSSGLYSTTTNGAHWYPNNSGSYGTWRINGSRGGYSGIFHSNGGNVVSSMYDANGNGGDFHSTGWHYYWHRGNQCLGINGSSTSSSYGAYVTGSIYSTGNITAYSDRRKKENIVTVDSALEKVNLLRGVYYNRIDDETKTRQLGVIAQETEQVIPEAVTYAEDVDEYGVQYGNLAGVFIEAIKDLTNQVKELKSEIEELKNANSN